jgi:hypothetical protein
VPLPHHSEIFSGQETYLKNYNTYNEKSLLNQRKFLCREKCGKKKEEIKIGCAGVPEQATSIQFSSECLLRPPIVVITIFKKFECY